ncbi:S-formylglutathione hydrolase FrmB [Filimonas lacunae]|uniref:S-formylglutathione hydrolase FrmB n=1 Tax=Filimonas lacunae TaxID=477680 RepID=A0A173ME41_9BACT|nr:alpha/beta hydrolase family protein [Filimonas lacunae]BAV05854.1 endo-1,4-beta-xylanase A precursor [Filimonas lacunae]SIT28353.1 S-formylglutathione hydrolase FrmB [Filimonas lacunae]
MRFLLILLLCLPTWLHAQKSQVINSLPVKSNILQNTQHIAIYLPAGYAKSNTQYPVLYLLHGAGGNYRSWLQDGNLQHIADSFLQASKTQCIIVMPDAAMTFYLDNIHGHYSYETYFFNELIPYIEAHYRCKPDRRFRAIAGLSMGGFGSLLYAMHRPAIFSSCYAMSAAVRTDEDIIKMPLADFRRRYTTALDSIADTDNRITPFLHQNSILYLAEHIPDSQKQLVRFFIDCGDDDPLSKGNALLHILMQEKGILHEYRVRNGAHTWDYWKQSLPQALQFITQAFQQL